VKITPVETDLNKVFSGPKKFKHTALKIKLDDGSNRIIEHGGDYG
jgi:hypothetical protein